MEAAETVASTVLAIGLLARVTLLLFKLNF